jgi:hypothetical protein
MNKNQISLVAVAVPYGHAGKCSEILDSLQLLDEDN